MALYVLFVCPGALVGPLVPHPPLPPLETLCSCSGLALSSPSSAFVSVGSHFWAQRIGSRMSGIPWTTGLHFLQHKEPYCTRQARDTQPSEGKCLVVSIVRLN